MERIDGVPKKLFIQGRETSAELYGRHRKTATTARFVIVPTGLERGKEAARYGINGFHRLI